MGSLSKTGLYLLVLLLMGTFLATTSDAALALSPSQAFTVTPLAPESFYRNEQVKQPLRRPADQRIGVIVRLREREDVAAFERNSARAIPEAQITHQFHRVFRGVSMALPQSRLRQLASMPQVAAVYQDRLLQPDTGRSPAFIGAPDLWNQVGGQTSAGEGVIVGVLDTGIWPEHPSFSDPDPSGKAYAAPPITPGTNGFSAGPRSTCDFGNTGANANDAPFTCNNKLIGAYNFTDSYKAVHGLLATEFNSARDDNGHGTHTASTAAGNGGVAATLLGVDRGQVSGIAPRAHVIMYRVCGVEGCMQSDSVAAVQQAILDGVDVINFSISGGSYPYADPVSLAFLDAYNAGIFVAASAGQLRPRSGHCGPPGTLGDHRSRQHFRPPVCQWLDPVRR